MSKSEAKKEHILSRGLEVMQAQGYNGTSVKDIVEAAGVPKGSFYNYFESKEAFAVEALVHAASASYQDAVHILGNSSESPLSRLTRFFEHSSEPSCSNEFRVGCFMGNMCQEMADNSELIRLQVKANLAKVTALITNVLAESELPEGQDKAETAEFLFNAWEGALMRMKAEKSRDPLDAFLKFLPKTLGS